MFDRVEKGLWWDRAWPLVEGCSPVSEGCDHCWAARATHMRAQQKNVKIQARYAGLTNKDGTWNKKIRLMEDLLRLPLRVKKPTVWAIWNDLFHPEVPAALIQEAYDVMGVACQHLFIICTKRPERIVQVLYEEGYGYFGGGDYLPNVWHLTTAETQQQADSRIPELLKLRDAAAGWPVLGVSVEPMLESMRLAQWLPVPPMSAERAKTAGSILGLSDEGGRQFCDSVRKTMEQTSRINWIVCAPETGPQRRPMERFWVRNLRDEARAAGVPFWLKKMEIGGRLEKMPLLDGRQWKEIPNYESIHGV